MKKCEKCNNEFDDKDINERGYCKECQEIVNKINRFKKKLVNSDYDTKQSSSEDGYSLG